MALLALLVLGLVVTILFVSTYNYSKTIRVNREKTVTGAATLAVQQINGDRIEEWISNGKDAEYNETEEALNDIVEATPYLKYLYVYVFEDDKCVVVFDLIKPTASERGTSEEEVPDLLGDERNIDQAIGSKIKIIREGGEPDAYESHDEYGWLMTKYSPIYDSNGKCVAYVGADVYMHEIDTYVEDVIGKTALVAGIIFIVYVVLSLYTTSLFRKADEKQANLKEEQNAKRLFDQTAKALANAIDAKDKYTHGHSIRVAEYSRKIAELAGKSEKECEEIYYAGLLHDVGKIGVPEHIITKEGKLTNEEYNYIKQHPVMGADILDDIPEYPYLSIGARYHHERYDGKGYPDGLAGTDIPDIARIIAVADAYDAMTSNRSYRESIPQQKVREEFVECSGTQFDPEYANIMIHLIDQDMQYKMKERANKGLEPKDNITIGSHKETVSRGFLLEPNMIRLGFKVSPDSSTPELAPKPSFILFDSLDGRYHDNEKEINELIYFEYCELGFNGEFVTEGARLIKSRVVDPPRLRPEPGSYMVEAVKVRDHAFVKIIGNDSCYEYTIALPDSTRFVYLGLTGEHCLITDMSFERLQKPVPTGFITRIAEEISYINVPSGDIPNVQIDGYRTASSEEMEIKDGLSFTFHTQSLPTARLVWHCPFCVIFSSDDGTLNGNNYIEYALIRLDGETWKSGEYADNELVISREDFEGWGHWKECNRNGFESTISFERKGNKVVTVTKNNGISIRNTTVVKDKKADIFVALTGDQCALTNIRINF